MLCAYWTTTMYKRLQDKIKNNKSPLTSHLLFKHYRFLSNPGCKPPYSRINCRHYRINSVLTAVFPASRYTILYIPRGKAASESRAC